MNQICLINNETNEEENKREDSLMDEETDQEETNSTANKITGFTSEEDNCDEIQNNEEIVTSCVKSNTEDTAVESSDHLVSTPKPCTTSSKSSPLVIMPTIDGISNIEDGKLMPDHAAISLIKTTSPNTLTTDQLINIDNRQTIKEPVSAVATTSQIVVKSLAISKNLLLHEHHSHKSSINNSVEHRNKTKVTIAGKIDCEQNQKDQVSRTGQISVGTTQQTVYKCPIAKCGKYNQEEDMVKQHMRQTHKIQCPTPLKQVIEKKQSSAPKPLDIGRVLATNDGDRVTQLNVDSIKVYKCPINGCDSYDSQDKLIRRHVKEVHNRLCATPLKPVEKIIEKEQVVVTAKPQISTSQLKKDYDKTDEDNDLFFASSFRSNTADHSGSAMKDDDYVTAKKKHHFIPNSSFGPNKAFGSQARELIISLKLYFELKHRDWCKERVFKEIAQATRLSSRSVKRIVLSFEKHKKIVGHKPVDLSDRRLYKCTDEDRDVLLQCMYKLKDDRRLKTVRDVYYEITKSDQFNPSFKGCRKSTFYKLFVKTGLKIGERLISNRKPELISKEKGYGISPLKSASGLWECDWTGCEKTFKLRANMLEHVRCHTDDKPYECIFPKCRYKCRTMSNINHHQRSHNKDK